MDHKIRQIEEVGQVPEIVTKRLSHLLMELDSAGQRVLCLTVAVATHDCLYVRTASAGPPSQKLDSDVSASVREYVETIPGVTIVRAHVPGQQKGSS